MSHLEAAKALVADHIAASNEVLAALDSLTNSSDAVTQAAVEAATADVAQANDVLTAQINVSLAQLREIAARRIAVVPGIDHTSETSNVSSADLIVRSQVL